MAKKVLHAPPSALQTTLHLLPVGGALGATVVETSLNDLTARIKHRSINRWTKAEFGSNLLVALLEYSGQDLVNMRLVARSPHHHRVKPQIEDPFSLESVGLRPLFRISHDLKGSEAEQFPHGFERLGGTTILVVQLGWIANRWRRPVAIQQSLNRQVLNMRRQASLVAFIEGVRIDGGIGERSSRKEVCRIHSYQQLHQFLVAVFKAPSQILRCAKELGEDVHVGRGRPLHRYAPAVPLHDEPRRLQAVNQVAVGNVGANPPISWTFPPFSRHGRIISHRLRTRVRLSKRRVQALASRPLRFGASRGSAATVPEACDNHGGWQFVTLTPRPGHARWDFRIRGSNPGSEATDVVAMSRRPSTSAVSTARMPGSSSEPGGSASRTGMR